MAALMRTQAFQSLYGANVTGKSGISGAEACLSRPAEPEALGVSGRAGAAEGGGGRDSVRPVIRKLLRA